MQFDFVVVVRVSRVGEREFFDEVVVVVLLAEVQDPAGHGQTHAGVDHVGHDSVGNLIRVDFVDLFRVRSRDVDTVHVNLGAFEPGRFFQLHGEQRHSHVTQSEVDSVLLPVATVGVGEVVTAEPGAFDDRVVLVGVVRGPDKTLVVDVVPGAFGAVRREKALQAARPDVAFLRAFHLSVAVAQRQKHGKCKKKCANPAKTVAVHVFSFSEISERRASSSAKCVPEWSRRLTAGGGLSAPPNFSRLLLRP